VLNETRGCISSIDSGGLCQSDRLGALQTRQPRYFSTGEHGQITGVTLNIGVANALPSEKQKELEELLGKMKAEIETLRKTNPQSAKMVERRLNEVLDIAATPPEKREPGAWDISVGGLMDAAKGVTSVVAALLPLAKELAGLIVGAPR
jgi:hypothetical protein